MAASTASTANERGGQVIGYARINTFDHDPALQITTLRRAGCEVLFADILSGFHWSSTALALDSGHVPEWHRILAYLQSGDTLLITNLDRMAWTLSYLVRTLVSLKNRGVQFCALDQGIDTRTATGRSAFFGLVTILDRFERELLSERMRLVIQNKKKHNLPWGGRSVFDDPAQVEVVRALLRDRTIARIDIARFLGVSPSVLYKWFPAGDPDGFLGRWKHPR